MSPSALHRHPAAPTPSGATGRVHRALHAVDSDVARLTGRFHGDLATEQWWWSPELHALYGMPDGSTLPGAQLLLAHVHPADRPGVQEALAVACTTGAAVTREHRVVRADGEQRTVVLACEPETDASGAVVALAGLVVDITEGRPPQPADEHVHQLETEVEQLRSAMASRAAIEQAKGVLMLLMSCGDQVAFDLLAHISSHTHRKVRDVAVAIVDSASGRHPLPDDVREILHDASPPGRSV
ncbi:MULTISPECIES: PAS and ANTAR domain-containing protein [unclassified Modestobacter]|uniref:PAS and ANTAR domain-containing protein n=1 Tax=unclassified Modestobacter TaxID=2643866 RepID=UPI0022AB4938|nr:MULTISPECIES: PAS and ANTAR domain-containing protein [unclassified Modestobacter]MCZ2818862.1 PAS and ANTAR domain-containing protein [Modestobacter sp. VKM Ac-2977]MCZ2846742.1 PAS and ANTAR domain-containing protein [Modestobacter sp. VKM Ac-2978]